MIHDHGNATGTSCCPICCAAFLSEYPEPENGVGDICEAHYNRVITLNGDWDDYRPVDIKATQELSLPDDRGSILYDTPTKLACACALILMTFSENTAFLYRRNPDYKPSTDSRKFIVVVRGKDKVYRKVSSLAVFDGGEIKDGF